MMTMAGLGEGETGVVAGAPLVAEQNSCYQDTSCIPFFQQPVQKGDNKCGCQSYPEMTAMGVFLLPIMPLLILVQKQCGQLGTGDHAKYGDQESGSTFCRTLNSSGMAIPALALNLVGWWLIYKTVFKGDK